MEITKKEYDQLIAKARRWDTLEEKIAKCYGELNEAGEWVENEDEDTDLTTIGEIAALAFGFL